MCSGVQPPRQRKGLFSVVHNLDDNDPVAWNLGTPHTSRGGSYDDFGVISALVCKHVGRLPNKPLQFLTPNVR